VVADFQKIGTVHSKFGEKNRIGQVRFFQPAEFLDTAGDE
jgi:hypothetical protein